MDKLVLEFLKQIDREVLLYFNSIHSPFWDQVMIYISNKYFWIPFYILVVGFLIWKFKTKGIYIVLFIASTAIAADQISTNLFKKGFERLRPCHEESLKGLVRVVDGCGGSFGFVSSHAANTFAFAVFLILLLHKYNKWVYTMLPWATMVSYSRVYLGVHYPGDIIGGAILGSLLALLFFWLYQQFRVKVWKDIKSV